MEIIAFITGLVFAQAPSIYCPLLMVAAIYLRFSWLLLIYFTGAIAWFLFHQWWVSDQGMPRQDVIAKAELTGRIISIPVMTEGREQFLFEIDSLNGRHVKAQALLSCYQSCPSFQAGQYWGFSAKLRKPQPPGNPGMKNYQRTLYARHINWTGYLQGREFKNIHRTNYLDVFLRLREQITDLIKQQLPNSPVSAGIIAALTVGVTSGIEKQTWDLFRSTGTTHLMVISGAHIGLISGMVYWLTRRLWGISPRLLLLYPAPKIASLLSIVTAFVYSLSAGFAVPAQRAFLACFFLALKNFINHRITGWQAWRYALWIVVLVEPHAVLLPGFYLSFIAVALLISVGSCFSHYPYLKKYLLIQFVCLVGLMPMTLFWFSYASINGFFANLLAIPWVGHLILPFSFIALIFFALSHCGIAFVPVDYLIKIMLYFLEASAKLKPINIDFVLNAHQFVALSIGILCLFLRNNSLKIPAFLLIISTFMPTFPRVGKGNLVVNILDVGQGLSVLIRTEKHSLIYDTGGKFYQGSDMGQLVIIPYLQTLGIKQIDKIIISHPDLDHRGGLASLEANLKILGLVVDKPDFYKRGDNCHQYPDWDWDGVHFHFFSIPAIFRDKNNSSCVLKVTSPNGTILFTGDIERLAENYLAGQFKQQLKSDVLIVPHHGSKTSSSEQFVQLVAPKYAVISAGFDNRFHFPHVNTSDTLIRHKAVTLITKDCGMITWRAGMEPYCYRK